jgi:hypothetical protein
MKWDFEYEISFMYLVSVVMCAQVTIQIKPSIAQKMSSMLKVQHKFGMKIPVEITGLYSLKEYSAKVF